MFDIYIKDYNDQNGNLVSEETLVQSIPSNKEELKLINPTVKCEMGNAESFTFSMESGTKYYDSFNQMKTFMRVVYDGWTIFFGRVLTIENSFYGNRRIRLEGPLAFLNDTSVEGQKEENRPSVDGKDYLIALLNNHNNMVDDLRRTFTIGELPGNYSSSVSDAQRIVTKERKYGTDGWTDTKSALEDLRSHYGGYFRIRCPGYQSSDGKHWVVPNNIYGVQAYNFLDWMNHYFWKNEDTQEIEVGKNILDLTTSTEIDNIFTVVIPIGNNKSTSTETVDGEKKSTGPQHFYVDGREVTVPSICAKYGQALNSGYHTYEDYEQALNKYGRIVKTVTFDDANNKEELLEKCQEWIKNNYQGEVTKFTVKAVDMHQIGDRSVTKITVGDRVRIIYPVFKENGTVEKRTISRTCLSINYDLYNPENNSYTFGIPANILTKSYGVTKQGKSTTDPSTKPRSSGSGGGSGEKSWLDKVREWLMNHKVNYKHTASNWRVNDPEVYPNHPDVYPYKDSYKNRHQKGPYGDRRDYFYSTEYVGGTGHFTIWKFTRAGDEAIPELNPYIISEIRQSAAKGLEGKSAEYIAQVQDEAVEEYKKSLNCTLWTGEIVTMTTPLSEAIIHQYNIIQYVKQEYGYDLTIMGNTQMPPYTYTDPETGTRKTVQATEGKVVTIDMFKEGTTLAEGYHLTVAPDGSQVISVEVNGQLRYYTPDPDHPGEVVEFDKFDIRSEVVNTADSWGFARQKWFYDEKTQTWGLKTFEFTSSIERYAGGPLVVAKVQGDVVELGGVDSSQVITGALKNISNVCGEFEYEVDPETGERHVIVKEGSAILQTQDGAQMAYFHDGNLTGEIAINKINETGQTEAKISADQVRIEGKTFVQAGIVEPTYLELTAAEVQGKNPKTEGWYEYNKTTKQYVLTDDTKPQSGKTYYRKNPRAGQVTGELLIQHINGTDETEAKLDADQIRIHGRTFYEAGLVDEDGMLTGGLIVEKINNETTTCITGDHIVIGQRKDGQLTKDITITASDSARIGLFKVDDDGNAIMEAGTKIYRTIDGVTAAYGIWDSSGQNVEAGLIFKKLNNNETSAYLEADNVRIYGKTLVQAGIVDSNTYRAISWSVIKDSDNPSRLGWFEKNANDVYVLSRDARPVHGKTYYEINPNKGKMTGEFLIHYINENETEAKLTADQIRIQGKTFFEAGLVDENGYLTGGMVVQKINNETITHVRGDRVVIGDNNDEESVMSALLTSGVVTSSKVNLSEWPTNVNPKKQGWYNINNAGVYFLTGDVEVIAGHEYFYAPHNGKASRALVANSIYTKEINAVYGRFEDIEAHYLKVSELNAEIGRISSRVYIGTTNNNTTGLQIRSGSSLDLTGVNVTFTDAHLYGKNTGTPGYSANNMIVKAAVDTNDLVTLTQLDGGTVTFTSAVTLNKRTWSGGIYTPSALRGKIKNPSDGMTKIGSIVAPIMIDDPDHPGQKKYNDPWVTGTSTIIHRYFDVYHTWLNDKEQWESANTGFRTEVSIDANLVYVNGKKAATAKAPEFVLTEITTGTGGKKFYTTNAVQVRSVTEYNNYSSYATLSHAVDKFPIKNTTSEPYCVALYKDGTTLVGLYSIEDKHTDWVDEGKKYVINNATGTWNNDSPRKFVVKIGSSVIKTGFVYSTLVTTGDVTITNTTNVTQNVIVYSANPDNLEEADKIIMTKPVTIDATDVYNAGSVVGANAVNAGPVLFSSVPTVTRSGKIYYTITTVTAQSTTSPPAGISSKTGAASTLSHAVAKFPINGTTSEPYCVALYKDGTTLVGLYSINDKYNDWVDEGKKYVINNATGTWNNDSPRKFVVKIGNSVIKTGFVYDALVTTGGVTVTNTTYVTQNVIVYSANPDNLSEADKIIMTKSVTINANDVYNAGSVVGWKAAADNFVPTYYPSPEDVNYFDLKYPTSSPGVAEEVRYWLVEDSTNHKIICYLGNKSGGTTAPVAGKSYTVPTPSHNPLVTTNAAWYVYSSATEDQAMSAAAQAMGTSKSNLLPIDNGKFRNNSWIWFKVSCGTKTKYYYTKIT